MIKACIPLSYHWWIPNVATNIPPIQASAVPSEHVFSSSKETILPTKLHQPRVDGSTPDVKVYDEGKRFW